MRSRAVNLTERLQLLSRKFTSIIRSIGEKLSPCTQRLQLSAQSHRYASTPRLRHCPHCGRKLTYYIRYCPYCGAHLEKTDLKKTLLLCFTVGFPLPLHCSTKDFMEIAVLYAVAAVATAHILFPHPATLVAAPTVLLGYGFLCYMQGSDKNIAAAYFAPVFSLLLMALCYLLTAPHRLGLLKTAVYYIFATYLIFKYGQSMTAVGYRTPLPQLLGLREVREVRPQQPSTTRVREEQRPRRREILGRIVQTAVKYIKVKLGREVII